MHADVSEKYLCKPWYTSFQSSTLKFFIFGTAKKKCANGAMQRRRFIFCIFHKRLIYFEQFEQSTSILTTELRAIHSCLFQHANWLPFILRKISMRSVTQLIVLPKICLLSPKISDCLSISAVNFENHICSPILIIWPDFWEKQTLTNLEQSKWNPPLEFSETESTITKKSFYYISK